MRERRHEPRVSGLLALALGATLTLMAIPDALATTANNNAKPSTATKTQATGKAATTQSTPTQTTPTQKASKPKADQAPTSTSYRSTEPTAYRATTATAYRVSTAPQSQAYGNATRTTTPRGISTRGGVSCVPYARSVTGMTISGNAWQWWHNAAGVYGRGHVPEAGSVLAFRSNMRMPMGHVAVIAQVESARVVYIDHANWPIGGRRGAVSKGVAVVDVSERNDWTAVRVALGRGEDYGSIYPTHGFIYNRADGGTLLVTRQIPAPQLALNSPPRDLRPGADRLRPYYTDRAFEEVAEAPHTRTERAYTPALAEPAPLAPAPFALAPAIPIAPLVTPDGQVLTGGN